MNSQIIPNTLLVRGVGENTLSPAFAAFMVVEATCNAVPNVVTFTGVRKRGELEFVIVYVGKLVIRLFYQTRGRMTGYLVNAEFCAGKEERKHQVQ